MTAHELYIAPVGSREAARANKLGTEARARREAAMAEIAACVEGNFDSECFAERHQRWASAHSMRDAAAADEQAAYATYQAKRRGAAAYSDAFEEVTEWLKVNAPGRFIHGHPPDYFAPTPVRIWLADDALALEFRLVFDGRYEIETTTDQHEDGKSFTPVTRLRRQQPGENINYWGDRLDTTLGGGE